MWPVQWPVPPLPPSPPDQVFISDLMLKLHGLQKQEDLHNDGIDLPQLHIYSSRSGSEDREVLHWRQAHSDRPAGTILERRGKKTSTPRGGNIPESLPEFISNDGEVLLCWLEFLESKKTWRTVWPLIFFPRWREKNMSIYWGRCELPLLTEQVSVLLFLFAH